MDAEKFRNVSVDRETYERLSRLAEVTKRTRPGVIRLLVERAEAEGLEDVQENPCMTAVGQS